METYQFYATPENGVIRIPDEYKDMIKDTVRVIVMEENLLKEVKTVRAGRKSDMLLPPSMRTRGWQFSREEANERR